MTSLDLVAIAAVLLIGVPHGGLDGALARRLGWSQTRLAWLQFHLVYLSLAGAITWLWWLWPGVSLAAFLIISAWHFGRSDTCDTGSHWLPLLAHGGLVPIAIPGLQEAAVEPVFALLTDTDQAAKLIDGIGLMLLPWAILCLVYAGSAWRQPQWRKPALSLLLFICLAYLRPPLISFALYFCLWHSREHTLRTWRMLKSKEPGKPQIEQRRSLIEASVYSLMAWAVMIGFFYYFQAPASTALVQLTFIGLAALTVPHMLLVDFGTQLKQRRLLP